jgi:hypothetical protein
MHRYSKIEFLIELMRLLKDNQTFSTKELEVTDLLIKATNLSIKRGFKPVNVARIIKEKIAEESKKCQSTIRKIF